MASKSPQEMMATMIESMQKRAWPILQERGKLVVSSGIDPLDQNAVRNKFILMAS